MTRNFKTFIVSILFFFSLLSGVQEVLAQKFSVDTIVYNGNPDKLINMVFMGDGFREAELNTYKAKVQEVSNYIFTISPFSQYKEYFNVFAIRVPSLQSGANHPGIAADESSSNGQPVISVTTYFNAAFDIGSIHRLLAQQNFVGVNNVLVNNFPLFDQGLMLVNSPYYGGSGGFTATTSLHPDAREILVHEMGHSFANLADEYYAGDGYAVERANMTKQTNPDSVRWKNWLGFEGVGIYKHGTSGNAALWYKPSINCKMQFLGSPFCPVCKEAIIETIHQMVSPVYDYQPSTQTVNSFCTQPITYKVSLIAPLPNTLNIKWILNGNTIVRNNDSVNITSAQLKVGVNTLSVEVVDTNMLVRSQSHLVNHKKILSWTINNASPLAPAITADGSTTFCMGGKVTLKSSVASGNQWLKDGVVISGATTDSFQAITVGQYSVSINTNGCTAVSSPITVSIYSIPPMPAITTIGNTTFCAGGSVSLTSSAATGNQWLKDGIAISDATDKIFLASTSGQYSVYVNNAGVCVSEPSNLVTVNVTPIPLKPVISWNGTRLSAPGGFTGYRWFRDGIEIAGAESDYYQPDKNGLYKVTVRDINNCSATSDEFNLVVTGIADIRVGDAVISCYPNPARDVIYINVSNLLSVRLKAQLYDLHGRLMIEKVIISGSLNSLPTENLPSGMYQLLITNGKEKSVIKILLFKDK